MGPEVNALLEAWVMRLRREPKLNQKMGTRQMAAFLREQGYTAVTHDMVRRWRETRYPDERFRT